MKNKITIGIITASDRASKGIYEDLSGPAILEVLNEYIQSDFDHIIKVIPDEEDQIESAMIELVDNLSCCLVITTGGTGPALRDITPEVTEKVCQKMMPGFGELMRQTSLQYVPTAILSRQTAGIRNKALILNLPGKPKSIRECLEAVFPAIPYCIDLIEGPYIEANENYIKVFRPKKK
ncbi:MAG: molybdopterin adenylyltransferase [Candidatus Cloacimonadota bacterium]|nr:MAG: molybdopterin adenylyltransferase [Candidatus Cloacimonadota bacterium]